MGALGNLFTKRQTPLIGIDISASSVKVLELARKGDGYQVTAFATEPMPPNAIVDRNVAEPEIVAQAIARAVKRAGTRTKATCVAVSGSSVITKTIQMPASLREAEMEDQIKLEADQHIPYPVEEVNLDFEIIRRPTEGEDTTDVLLAACRSETVESRVSAVEMAGLEAEVVDIEAFALENACEFLRPQMPDRGDNKTIALIDIGDTSTSVLILHDNRTVYTRDQQFGGRQLTEDIMRHYGLSLEEATKGKKFGNLPEGYETEVLPYFVDDLAQQIDRSLQFFFANSPKFDSIDQLILAGGSAAIPRLDAMVQEKLRVPTVVAEPFTKMSVARGAKPKQLLQEQTGMLVACGLAMRALD